MNARFATVAQQLGISHGLWHRALDGLDRDTLVRRVAGGNPLIWIAGHMTVVRGHVLAVAGRPLEHPWGKLFERGAELQEGAAYPDFADVARQFDRTQGELMACLESITDEQAAKPVQGFPSLDDTVGGVLGFLPIHDLYHLGQLGWIRRRSGLDSLVG